MLMLMVLLSLLEEQISIFLSLRSAVTLQGDQSGPSWQGVNSFTCRKTTFLSQEERLGLEQSSLLDAEV